MPEAPRHIGVMLVNTGTPDDLTPEAVRAYLAKFLSDPRIVRVPPVIWQPILHGIVLRTRPKRTIPRYAKVWTDEGALYTLISRKQERALEQALRANGYEHAVVRIAQRYGTPSIGAALDELLAETIDDLVVIPLYPQSAFSQMETVRDEFKREWARRAGAAAVHFVESYGDNEHYHAAVADSLAAALAKLPEPAPGQSPFHVVFSFHSIPVADMDDGDDYPAQVDRSIAAIVERAGLTPDQWTLAFSSRFDNRKWLSPFIRPTLAELAQRNYRTLVVICPGFATDCIESIVEIGDDGRQAYLEAAERAHPDAPHEYVYIEALNATPAAIELYTDVVARALASA